MTDMFFSKVWAFRQHSVFLSYDGLCVRLGDYRVIISVILAIYYKVHDVI